MNTYQEFQVVVLAAGKGSRMPELTRHKPKCLLPIGGKPMIWYPLQKLQEAGFAEVILIINDKDKNEIHTSLDKTGLAIKIDYIAIQCADEWGTAESLRSLSDKIKQDLIIVSCDLITNCNFASILHEFRKNDATLCALYFPQDIHENVIVPGPKSKSKPERDLVAIDAQTNRLVFLASSSDFEAEVSMPFNTFMKHPHVKMYSNLLDSHFYVMKNWLLKYLTESHKYSTFKGEFLPHAIKQQFKHRKIDQIQVKSSSSEVQPVKNEDIFDFHDDTKLQKKISAANAFNDHTGDMAPAYHGDEVKCYAIIADKEMIGIRVNTLPAYWSLNGKIGTDWEKLFADVPLIKTDPKSESTIKSNQIDKCFIWDNVILNEKTSFKNSILGSNTNVASFSRVINSIVMNNVSIAEKVVIENCIICDDAIINANCKLKGCIIGAKQNVAPDSEHTNEVLVDTEIF